MKEAEKEKHEGTKGQWQLESPAREYLEQVKIGKNIKILPEEK